MLQFLLDTDHLTLFDHGHPLVVARYTSQPANSVGVTAITVEEALRGRLAALIRHPTGPLHIQAFSHLTASVRLLQQFPVAPYDQAADDEFQRLRRSRIRIGTRDLKIA